MGVSICCRGYSRLLDRCSEPVPGRGTSPSVCLAHFATTNLGLLIVLEEFPPCPPPHPPYYAALFMLGLQTAFPCRQWLLVCLMCVIVQMLGRHFKSNFRSSTVLVCKPTSGIRIIQD